jgi:hypothetical protein
VHANGFSLAGPAFLSQVGLGGEYNDVITVPVARETAGNAAQCLQELGRHLVVAAITMHGCARFAPTGSTLPD